jgi:hypothetical protein
MYQYIYVYIYIYTATKPETSNISGAEQVAKDVRQRLPEEKRKKKECSESLSAGETEN